MFGGNKCLIQVCKWLVEFMGYYYHLVAILKFVYVLFNSNHEVGKLQLFIYFHIFSLWIINIAYKHYNLFPQYMMVYETLDAHNLM